jgi:hypothetical protein
LRAPHLALHICARRWNKAGYRRASFNIASLICPSVWPSFSITSTLVQKKVTLSLKKLQITGAPRSPGKEDDPVLQLYMLKKLINNSGAKHKEKS